MSSLNGWRSGERIVHHKLGHDFNPSIMSQYQYIDCDLPTEHANFHSVRLPFLPVTTLDDTGRPWGSILAGKDGEPGFIRNSRYSVLSPDVQVWPGEPILDTAMTFWNREVAGSGIEFPSRRNKFAGRRGWTLEVRHCPRISQFMKRLEIVRNISTSGISSRIQPPHPKSCTKNLISHTKTVSRPCSSPSFTTLILYSSALHTRPLPKRLPSSLRTWGMNQRGGRPGFVRVRPFDGRTVVLADYSGDRFMTSLGNVEATSLVSLTFVSFTTGDTLYLTGTGTNLFGDPASHVMLFQQRLTTVYVDAYTFGEDALQVRQGPWSEVKRSPDSPPVRLLADEMGKGTLLNLRDAGKVQARLKRVNLHNTNIAMIIWELVSPTPPSSPGDYPLTPHASIRPGQAAILDFTPFLGQPAYQHMAPLKPSVVNDDRIRT